MMKTLYDFKIKSLSGTEVDLSQLKGKKVLIVNTASECGFTPQFGQLEELYKAYRGEGFEILAFPCNDFGDQEPLEGEDILAFCTTRYKVKFPIMEKVRIKGDKPYPLYAWLTKKALNGVGDFEVTWNFQKFLIDENGQLIRSISPNVSPVDAEILDWLNG